MKRQGYELPIDVKVERAPGPKGYQYALVPEAMEPEDRPASGEAEVAEPERSDVHGPRPRTADLPTWVQVIEVAASGTSAVDPAWQKRTLELLEASTRLRIVREEQSGLLAGLGFTHFVEPGRGLPNCVALSWHSAPGRLGTPASLAFARDMALDWSQELRDQGHRVPPCMNIVVNGDLAEALLQGPDGAEFRKQPCHRLSMVGRAFGAE